MTQSVESQGSKRLLPQAVADASLDDLGGYEVVVADVANTGDPKAQKEAISLNDGLDLEGKKREHDRHQKFRDHANAAVLAVLWLIVGTLLLGIITFSFHALSPLNWHFLNVTQLADLKGMLGTAILSSALTGYANKRMT